MTMDIITYVKICAAIIAAYAAAVVAALFIIRRLSLIHI